MFIRAMVRIFSFGERWNVPFNSAVASLNGTFHLSPHENILTIALINIDHYLHNIVQFYIVKLCEIIVRTIFAGISILLLSKSFSSYISKCLLQQLLPGGIYCIYLKPRDYKSANHVWCSPYLYNNYY